jgi:hypothetical protein
LSASAAAFTSKGESRTAAAQAKNAAALIRVLFMITVSFALLVTDRTDQTDSLLRD